MSSRSVGRCCLHLPWGDEDRYLECGSSAWQSKQLTCHSNTVCPTIDCAIASTSSLKYRILGVHCQRSEALCIKNRWRLPVWGLPAERAEKWLAEIAQQPWDWEEEGPVLGKPHGRKGQWAAIVYYCLLPICRGACSEILLYWNCLVAKLVITPVIYPSWWTVFAQLHTSRALASYDTTAGSHGVCEHIHVMLFIWLQEISY